MRHRWNEGDRPVAVPVGLALEQAGSSEPGLEVVLSHELVALLSEQLYQSPLKAIEELVVNAYDADALRCSAAIPALGSASVDIMLIIDNGAGMDHEGLKDLWHVGHSTKRSERIATIRKRKQIGKFGIGKLATYAIANRVTYVTKTEAGGILTTSLDFSRFESDPTGGRDPLHLAVTKIRPGAILDNKLLVDTMIDAGVDPSQFIEARSWTIVILEELKPKAQGLKLGRLNWILSTAMPLRGTFNLYLNGDQIVSSKEDYERVASFKISELPDNRLKGLEKSTGEKWIVDGESVRCASFPRGISGNVIVTRRTIFAGKSSDLGRSHGFFIRVLDRLVNLEDPLFGMRPLSYETFNRFRADVDVDDLDEWLTAPRESVESSPQMEALWSLLEELYYEARSRYKAWQTEQEKPEKQKPEHDRQPVDPRYLDDPIADVLSQSDQFETGTTDSGLTLPFEDPLRSPGVDADDEWFYLKIPADADIKRLIESAYSSRVARKYSYQTIKAGSTGRLVKFDPVGALFEINADHPLVRAHADSAAEPLLEDIVTAEALLEVYLREQGMRAEIIGEILERRDQLFRALTKDRTYSFAGIAGELRESASDERELEINLVLAARALGFVAKHISGANEPDGVARFLEYTSGEIKITLEAKASGSVPSLSAIDFSGLGRHVEDHQAQGCLLVAPSYPGSSKGDDAAAAKSAVQQRVSCWTVEQLARVVAAADHLHLNARNVLDIVLTAFTPVDVTAAIEKLLATPQEGSRELYRAIVDALKSLDSRLPGTQRNIHHIAAEVSRTEEFSNLRIEELTTAVRNVAGASQGALTLRDERLIVNTSIDELKLRLGGILGTSSTTRRKSTFRAEE